MTAVLAVLTVIGYVAGLTALAVTPWLQRRLARGDGDRFARYVTTTVRWGLLGLAVGLIASVWLRFL